jgi:hypothetical protein
MPRREFICAVCHRPYVTDTTEAEANRELLDSGIPTTDCQLLSACDECYQIVMRRAREMGLLE